MKSLFLALGLATFLSCNVTDHLFTTMSEGDIAALNGMQEGYDNALKYNDLLMHCFEAQVCTSEDMELYDAQFHHFDAMFDQHHDNYSHDNSGDDHHHEGGEASYGAMSMHSKNEQEMHMEDPLYMHTAETFQLMLDLRTLHADFCPE